MSQAYGPAGRSQQSELRRALGGYRGAFVGAASLSAVLNVLTLSGSFFMLLVYDSVLPSRPWPSSVRRVLLIPVAPRLGDSPWKIGDLGRHPTRRSSPQKPWCSPG